VNILNIVLSVRCELDDLNEGSTNPGPGVVNLDVGRVGDEWSVVCVELARLIRRAVVVVRVADSWHGAVGHAVQVTIHLKGFATLLIILCPVSRGFHSHSVHRRNSARLNYNDELITFNIRDSFGCNIVYNNLFTKVIKYTYLMADGV